jgi:hypothetical protein
MADELAGAFDEFDAACRETRSMIEATPRFRDKPAHRAQAYQSLAEARAMAYNLAIAPRLDHPRVHSQSSWHSTWFSLGQNCPDFRYGATLLDGRRRYRLRGRLGELKLLLFQVQNQVMGHPDSAEIGNYDLHELADDQGNFDIALSAQRQDGPWIRLDPTSPINFVMVRRILGSIADDQGSIRLTDEDPSDAPLEIDPAAMADRLHRAADLLRFLVSEWCIGLYELYIRVAGGKNRFAHIPGKELASNLVGSPSTTYGLAIYQLDPGEALIVDWVPPDSAYWSFQLGDVWSNALDFMNYQTDVNMDGAAIDPDGRFRAVVCDTDPGTANWLDTRGRTEGSLVMRNYRARGESVAPTLRRVRVDQLADELPATITRISGAQRALALADRRENYLRAFGD